MFSETQVAGSVYRHIHDRMLVILPRDATKDWLNPKYNALEVLQAAVAEVEFVPVEGVQCGIIL